MTNESKDKFAVLQVIGCLMQRPLLLLDDAHPLTEADFPERFHKIIFGAIEFLAKNGVQNLSFASIDNFLEKYERQHKVFSDNRGAEYLERAVQLSDPDNFELYYSTLRKHSLLTQLAQHGFDTSLVYDPNLVQPQEIADMQRKFDEYTVDDILKIYQNELTMLDSRFAMSSISTGCQAGKGAAALKERYKEAPEMGMPMNSQYLTTITYGRRLKKLYLRTAPSGVGKTRISVGDACCTAIPTIWDSDAKKWVSTNCREPTMYITTELEIDEIQSLMLSYIADVPEDQLIAGKYTADEEKRMDRAIEILEDAPLYIVHIPNFDIDDLERTIKEYKLKYQIGYVFFDYIFTSIKMLTEIGTKARGVRMREDNALIMFMDRMKTLANALNIHIDTSSQANGDWKTAKDADQNLIRGAKGMADKADVGLVVLEPTEEDRRKIEPLLSGGFTKQPNLVFHIYKVRRSKLNHVKLWVYFDYATCRTYDIFVTDNNYRVLDVKRTSVEAILNETTIDDTSAPELFY